MPGNLEAPQILPEQAYEVNQKSAENPYPTRVFAHRHQAGVKGAEGGEAHP
jgi:hypothetical protein